ncbi:MAG: UDP-N-acetylmuramoyl-L-alanyl-D-glutamate--2,6-diaminopimelate ligase [Acidobacteriota bacterium]
MKRLSELARTVDAGRLVADPAITGITHDSRQVRPGALFAALAGSVADGLDFVDDAVARGAAAVVCDRPAPAAHAGLPWIRVADARAALAALSRVFWDAPDRELMMAGITGTNGKTTTSILLAAGLEAAGVPTGVLGTLGVRSGREWQPTGHTTPEACDLFAHLDRMRHSGRRAAVIEVSSHALALSRVEGMKFDVAVFTNLSRDHLDYHRDMQTYFAAKARLFASLPPHAAMAVNLDDPFGTRLLNPPRTRVVTYGRATRAAILPLKIHADRQGMRIRLQTPGGPLNVESPLIGRPNLYNIMAAVAAAYALGLDLERVAEGIATVAGIPGRAEAIDEHQDFTVLVDYAHTDDALVNILRVARDLTRNRVLVVFGCGGDRDRTKRPLMGNAAARLADVAILTSDNPRTEDPRAIIDEVAAGMHGSGPLADCLIEPDRATAIRTAIDAAQTGDVVIIAGKGHETEQILGNRRIEFDDREQARRALRERLGKES